MPPTSAARWNTSSASASAKSRAAASIEVRSWSARRATTTSWPSRSRRSTRWEPRKPPPPVTRTRTVGGYRAVRPPPMLLRCPGAVGLRSAHRARGSRARLRGRGVPSLDHALESARVPPRRGGALAERAHARDGPEGRGRCTSTALLPLLRRLQEPALPVPAGGRLRGHRRACAGRTRALGGARALRGAPARPARATTDRELAGRDRHRRPRRPDAV